MSIPTKAGDYYFKPQGEFPWRFIRIGERGGRLCEMLTGQGFYRETTYTFLDDEHSVMYRSWSTGTWVSIPSPERLEALEELADIGPISVREWPDPVTRHFLRPQDDWFDEATCFGCRESFRVYRGHPLFGHEEEFSFQMIEGGLLHKDDCPSARAQPELTRTMFRLISEFPSRHKTP